VCVCVLATTEVVYDAFKKAPRKVRQKKSC
jgi:hypothetical protein